MDRDRAFALNLSTPPYLRQRRWAPVAGVAATAYHRAAYHKTAYLPPLPTWFLFGTTAAYYRYTPGFADVDVPYTNASCTNMAGRAGRAPACPLRWGTFRRYHHDIVDGFAASLPPIHTPLPTYRPCGLKTPGVTAPYLPGVPPACPPLDALLPAYHHRLPHHAYPSFLLLLPTRIAWPLYTNNMVGWLDTTAT